MPIHNGPSASAATASGHSNIDARVTLDGEELVNQLLEIKPIIPRNSTSASTASLRSHAAFHKFVSGSTLGRSDIRRAPPICRSESRPYSSFAINSPNEIGGAPC